MFVLFNKSGDVALNYGIDGVISVEKDVVVELLDKHASILINEGIAVEAKPTKETAKVIEEVKAEVKEEKPFGRKGKKNK